MRRIDEDLNRAIKLKKIVENLENELKRKQVVRSRFYLNPVVVDGREDPELERAVEYFEGIINVLERAKSGEKITREELDYIKAPEYLRELAKNQNYL